MLSDQEFEIDVETYPDYSSNEDSLHKAILAGTIPPPEFWENYNNLEYTYGEIEEATQNRNQISRYDSRDIEYMKEWASIVKYIGDTYLHEVIPLKRLAQRTIYYNGGDVSFQPYEIRKDFPEE